MRAIQKVTNVCAYSHAPVLLQPIIGFWCSVWCWKLPHAVVHQTLSRGKCRDGCADCEVQGVICFLQADEILGYLAEEASSRMKLFCCTTVHVYILPGRHKPCCMSNSIGTSLSILCTVWAWHRREFFPVSKNEGAHCWQMLRKWWPEGCWLSNQAATWYEEGIHKLVPNWTAFVDKTDEKSLVISIVLLKEATVWQSVTSFISSLINFHLWALWLSSAVWGKLHNITDFMLQNHYSTCTCFKGPPSNLLQNSQYTSNVVFPWKMAILISKYC